MREFAGNFTESACATLTTNSLEGKWESVTPTAQVGANLYCGVKLASVTRLSGSYTTNTCITQAASGVNTEFFRVLGPIDLPDLSLTLSGTYPIHAQGSVASKTQLGSAAGVTLEGTGVTLLLLQTALSSLGEFTATFTKVKSGTEECETTGAAKGNVIRTGLYHIVPLTTTGPIGLLLLVTTFEIVCPKNTLLVSGNLISSINAGTENQELSTFGGALLGSKGKQNISEYINDTGSKVKAKLNTEANKSGEPVASDENIEATEVPLAVLGSKMIVITGR